MAAETAAAAEGNNGPLVFEAFYWGLLSALSLNIGSLIGVTCLPSMKVRAILMSFGGGALLFALSIELFGSVLNRSSGSKVAVVMMIIFAIVGGVLFAFLNWALNSLGAEIRKPSTTKLRFSRLRFLLMRRLAMRLWNIPFFAVLSWEELKDLIQYGMYKARFVAGDTIMSDEVGDKGIFFILSGKVSAKILGKSSPKEKEVHELGPNQIFGDMAVLTGSYLKCIATALVPTKVLVLPGHEVARLLDVNEAIRNQVSMLAVQRLQQVAELRGLPEHVLASLSSRCELVSHKAGDVIFEGFVGAVTPVLCIVLGCVELSYKEGSRKTKVVHASRLICTHHLKHGKAGAQCCVKALEPTSVLVFSRADINAMLVQGARISLQSAPTVGSLEEAEEEVCIPGQILDPPSSEAPGLRSVGIAGGSVVNTMILGGRAGSICSESSSSSGEEEQGSSKGGVESAADSAEEESTSRSEARRSGGAPRAPSKLSRLGWDDSEVDALREEENKLARFTPASSTLDLAQEELEMDLSLSGSASQRRASRCMTIGTTRELRASSKRSWVHLGWESPDDPAREEPMHQPPSATNLRRVTLKPIEQVTDNELVEQEVNIERANRASPSKRSSSSSRALPSVEGEEFELPPTPSFLKRGKSILNTGLRMGNAETEVAMVGHAPSLTPELDSNPISSRATTLEEGGHNEGSKNRAVMVWLGILIDCMPESLVIGIIINKSAAGADESEIQLRVAAAALPFVLGVFLSNLPESMSSSGSMKAHGMRVRTILLMWLAITVLTAVGSALGALLFPRTLGDGGSEGGAELAVASVEGLAAGAMLTMIAQTMMPEAFEQGGDIVGLSCLAGFLCALSVKLIPLGESSGH